MKLTKINGLMKNILIFHIEFVLKYKVNKWGRELFLKWLQTLGQKGPHIVKNRAKDFAFVCTFYGFVDWFLLSKQFWQISRPAKKIFVFLSRQIFWVFFPTDTTTKRIKGNFFWSVYRQLRDFSLGRGSVGEYIN